jgi:acyl-CoA reductase-like NAD-dependent aldehyde dehydrogenase
MNTQNATFKTYSPIDHHLYFEGALSPEASLLEIINASQKAQCQWHQRPLLQRIELCHRWIDEIVLNTQAIALDLHHSLGRPLQQCALEVKGLEERARYMLDIAPQALADIELPEKTGFRRYIQHQPKGSVFVIAPWNYPYLTSINSIIPAIVAGNSVILKPALQTPKTALFYLEAAKRAGLPDDVFSFAFMDHTVAAMVVQHEAIQHVVFTGSVAGGAQIEQALAGHFKSRTLELGGKDAAYIRADANLDKAAASVLDGAFFNSGQSCCGIERIYVHQSIYQPFLEKLGHILKTYQLGHPKDSNTQTGPMIKAEAAQRLHQQVADALAAKAQLLNPEDEIKRQASEAELGPQYYYPRVVYDVTDNCSLMMEESFGPIVGVQAVNDDDEAIRKINASRYGLTAAIFSEAITEAETLGERIEAGTVFVNRCDYLDPALAWTGIKDSGCGCSLSILGFQALTQPKSFHLKLEP